MNIDSAIQLFQTLKDLGLTAKEANVYITLHGIGSNPASVIAKNAEINRSGCYTILNSLVFKNFVEKKSKNSITYFNVTDPTSLLNRLKHKKGQLNANIENINNLIKQYEELNKNTSTKPSVIFFEGLTAIRNVMESTLKSGDKILRAYASLDELTAILPKYWPSYYQRRTEKGIKVKAIYPANKLSYFHKKRDPCECRESRLIPPEFNFHLDIMIYSNKVAFTSLKEKFGLIIESDEMSQAYKKIFDLVWDGTSKYDQVMTSLMRQQYENHHNIETNR